MKQKFLAVLIGLLLPMMVFGAFLDEEIQHYQIEMEVLEDNSYVITETLTVVFHNLARHGIFREIPKTSRYGTPVRITDISVPGHMVKQSSEGGNLILRIGDPNRTVAPIETYQIHYRYHIGDVIDADIDELYFNLVGTEWNMPIQRTSFTITMPKPFDPDKLNFTYGYSGSTESRGVTYTIEGNTIRGELDRVLAARQGLTVALPLPRGYYSILERRRDIMGLAASALPWIFFAITLIGLAYYFLKGRNRTLIPAVEFYPPKGLNPAVTGYLYDNRVDPYDITSLIIYWADLGLIKILEEKSTKGVLKKKVTTLYLQKLRDIPPSMPGYERTLFAELFKKFGSSEGLVDVSSLKDRFHSSYLKAKQGLKRHADRNYPLHAKNMPVRKFLIVASLMVLITGGLFNILYIIPQARFWSLLWIPAAVIIAALMITLGQYFHAFPTYQAKDRFRMTLFLLIGLAGGAAAVWVAWLLLEHYSYTLLVSIAAALPMLVLVPFAELRSEEGNRLLEQILGFRRFIKKAERDRINRLVEEDPSYFYHILPYAMVFGITDKWAKQFEHITLPPPSWYAGSAGFLGSRAFCRTIERNTRTISSSMTSTPKSSGSGSSSSSGGSSGGGSGGGGGGGW